MSQPFYVRPQYVEMNTAQAKRFSAKPALYPDGTKGVLIYGPPDPGSRKWDKIAGVLPEDIALAFANAIVDSLEDHDA